MISVFISMGPLHKRQTTIKPQKLLKTLRCGVGRKLCPFPGIGRAMSPPQKIFTALHVMQTRYCDENSVYPSVRPSVRLSVCLSLTRVYCDKTVERSVQIYTPYERTFSLVSREEEWLVGGRPLLREILGQPAPVGAKSPIFNQ